MASGLFNSKAFQTILLIATMLVLSGLQFMSSVKSDLLTAATAIAGILTLIVVVDAFKTLGRK